MKPLPLVLIAGLALLPAAALAGDATSAGAQQAIAAAEAKISAAAAMQNQWFATMAAFRAAKAAERKGDYAAAEAAAAEAGKLADLSIAQARRQKALWQSEAVR
ncbi:MAG: hypothetical protein M0002_17040 [Rhodospirillales bacterium]|nr:hypothetical protein [Rhodospirillales bacterium]